MKVPSPPPADNSWIQGQIPRAPHERNVVRNWFSNDTEEHYWRSGNHEYGPNDIVYEINSYGYRSIEPDFTSSAKKILFLGCSFTMGVGLPLDEVWTTVMTDSLQQQYGVEIEQHNFGLGGCGNDVATMIASQVLPLLKPDLMVVMFSDRSRRARWTDFSRYAVLAGSYRSLYVSENDYSAYLSLQNDVDDFYNWVGQFTFIDTLAKLHSVPWIWASWPKEHKIPDSIFRRYVRQDNFVKLPPFYLPGETLARDNLHWGRAGNHRVGKAMAERATGMKVF